MITNQRQPLYDVPVPVATSTYQPVSHQQVIEELMEQFDRINLKPVSERYHVGRDGKQLIGYFNFASDDDELGHRVAFRNSYDKSMSVGFAALGNVWVCTNGMMGGKVAYTRLHTGSVVQELKNKIHTTINLIESEHKLLVKEKEQMKLIDVNRQVTAELAGRLFIEQDVINSTQLNIVKREIEFSEHFNEPTLWSFYNHVTEALKKSSPIDYFNRHTKLHEFIKAEYNV